MTNYDYPDASTSTIEPFTEERYAADARRRGDRVHFAHGRYWREFGRGFLEPVHWLAMLTESEARWPGRCWGYRATLDASAASKANASFPMHYIADISTYGPDVLPSDALRHQRRFERRGVKIVHVTDMRIFNDQGYEMMMDWRRRIPRRGAAPTRERFLGELEERIGDPGWVILAGLDGDRLIGYQTAFAVGDAAYLHEVRVATTDIARGLTAILDFAAMEVLKNSGRVTRVSSGVHQPEMPSLTAFKVRHGFPVVDVPARAWIAKPAELILRARRPLAYYRLTGRNIERAVPAASTDPDPPPPDASPRD